MNHTHQFFAHPRDCEQNGTNRGLNEVAWLLAYTLASFTLVFLHSHPHFFHSIPFNFSDVMTCRITIASRTSFIEWIARSSTWHLTTDLTARVAACHSFTCRTSSSSKCENPSFDFSKSWPGISNLGMTSYLSYHALLDCLQVVSLLSYHDLPEVEYNRPRIPSS